MNLFLTILTNVIIAAIKLVWLKPEVIIVAKSLPENVLAARLAAYLTRPKKIILDVDDFELTANVTSTWTQRAAIHWAERAGAKLAHHIVTITPFLSDHFEQLTQGKKPITMIPTGLSLQAEGASHERSARPCLVYAGSLTLSSGHRIDLLPDILFEIRKTSPEIQLHIYGDGDDVEKLKVIFAQKNLSDAVAWHGRFIPAELVKQLPANAILLDTIDGNITNRAKSSFRVALAAALGLPVVSSDIGIRPYLIPDPLHDRCFAKPGDPRDYAAKANAWLQKPLSAAEQISLKEHARQFSWETLGRRYENIITV